MFSEYPFISITQCSIKRIEKDQTIFYTVRLACHANYEGKEKVSLYSDIDVFKQVFSSVNLFRDI